MGTKRVRKAADSIHRERLPEYALKIREFRQQCCLTQPEFGDELGVKRDAVAKWEAADREPNQEHYTNLVALARRRNLKGFEEFFSSRVFALVHDREQRLDEAHARRFSFAIMRTGLGEELKSLAEFSKMDEKEYIRKRIDEVIEARKTLHNGEMAEVFSKIAMEVLYFKQLSMAGGLEAFRRISRLEDDLRSFHRVQGSDDIESNRLRRQIVLDIVNGWVIGLLEGSLPNRNELEKKLAENNLFGAMLAKISGVVAKKVAADKGEIPYDDAEFIRDLELAVAFEPNSANAKA